MASDIESQLRRGKWCKTRGREAVGEAAGTFITGSVALAAPVAFPSSPLKFQGPRSASFHSIKY